jgi:peroxidase
MPVTTTINKADNQDIKKTRFFSTLKNIIRSFDGTGNNLFNNGWGATHTSQVRKSFANYLDGFSQMDNSRVSPRLVSNTLGTLTSQSPVADQHNLNILFTIFGQFINHDIELTPSGS